MLHERSSVAVLRVVAWLALATAGLAASSAVAQEPQTWDAGRLHLTRSELELLLQKYEESGRSDTYSNEFKIRARAEADLVRRRLAEGDFQVGDQIEVAVEGEANSPFPLTVGPGRVLAIPNLGELSLVGVLRSELNARVFQHIARYIKNPTVRTKSNIRLAIMGRVLAPGYRNVSSESLLSDVIMAAGGPAPTADLGAARIERSGEKIWDGAVLQEAISGGRTLDQMSLRSGDQLVVPEAKPRGSSLMRVITVIPALILAIGGIAQIL